MKKTYISPNTEVLVMKAQDYLLAGSINIVEQDVDGGAAWAPEDKGIFDYEW